MSKVLVAMSGGVDSTVTAYLLKKEGYQIESVYMKLHDNPSYHEANIKKVEKAASFLGIKYHVLDLSKDFEKNVYTPFIETYKKGLTPNPCVICNRTIKLGALIEFAKSKGFDKLATGHYAKIKDGFIYEARDKTKDQSYFLSNVKKENLNFMLFPLGDMYKDDIKEIAKNIEVLKEFSEQKESTEICFVENTYLDILKDHINIDLPGNVVNTEGKTIGSHKGYMHYTIGKRRGFTVNGAHDPHYVVNIDAKNNQIVVGLKDDLNVSEFEVENVNMFINKTEFNGYVKIRYRSPKVQCKVTINDDKANIELQESVQGLAPGQAAVFYDGEKVIGSGWIV